MSNLPDGRVGITTSISAQFDKVDTVKSVKCCIVRSVRIPQNVWVQQFQWIEVSSDIARSSILVADALELAKLVGQQGRTYQNCMRLPASRKK